MRKEAGFEVTDRINVYAKADGKILDVLNKNAEGLKLAVLAQNIEITSDVKGFVKDWDIVGNAVTLGVEKA